MMSPFPSILFFSPSEYWEIDTVEGEGWRRVKEKKKPTQQPNIQSQLEGITFQHNQAPLKLDHLPKYCHQLGTGLKNMGMERTF